MITKPLPDKLTVGMQLCCSVYDSEEVVEVCKIDEYGKIKLMRKDGMVFREQFRRESLVNYDYRLVE